VKRIKCDNGGEYKNNALRKWCNNKGIVIEFTIPYSPQLNGTAERINRTIMEKER
jgi:transposase InsO family protein